MPPVPPKNPITFVWTKSEQIQCRTFSSGKSGPAAESDLFLIRSTVSVGELILAKCQRSTVYLPVNLSPTCSEGFVKDRRTTGDQLGVSKVNFRKT